MSLTLLSPPAVDAVSLAEMKAHLRLTSADEDALVTAALMSAARAVEARGRLALTPQQWRLALDAVPAETVFLPLAPVASVDAVSVIDSAGAPQAVDASRYETALGAPGRVRPAAPWPAPGVAVDGVRIDFTAGYADAASVPAPLKQAVKLLAAHFFETREAAGAERIFNVPQTVDALIAPYREMRL
ncbi:MAG: head-tail connector protein [Hyphococcus sp.]